MSSTTRTRLALPSFPSRALRKEWAKLKPTPNAKLHIPRSRINPARIRTAV